MILIVFLLLVGNNNNKQKYIFMSVLTIMLFTLLLFYLPEFVGWFGAIFVYITIISFDRGIITLKHLFKHYFCVYFKTRIIFIK